MNKEWKHTGFEKTCEQVFLPDKGIFFSTELTTFCGLHLLDCVGLSGQRSLRAMGPETSLSSNGLQLAIVVLTTTGLDSWCWVKLNVSIS